MESIPLTREIHKLQLNNKMAIVTGVGQGIGEAFDKQIQNILLFRPGTPQDVAGVVAFLLLSPADYMTGQAINVTGGMVMH